MIELDEVLAEAEIRNQVAGFSCRDQEKWEELADTFWPEATLALSWFFGTIGEFIEQSRQLSAPGRMLLKHLLGVPRVQVRGDRALSETDVAIMLRMWLGGTPVDITSWARFSDRFERRGGRWKISERVAIYEKDRADPVEPGARITWTIPQDVIDAQPEQYRHLAGALIELGRHMAPEAIVQGSAGHHDWDRKSLEWLTGCQTVEPSVACL